MTINLDMPTIVAAARRHYDARTLQAQTDARFHSGCLYSGPCAIGAAMTPEQRHVCDTRSPSTGILNLFDDHTVSFPTQTQVDHAQRLQTAHDSWVRNGRTFRDIAPNDLKSHRSFLNVLEEMETLYALPV